MMVASAVARTAFVADKAADDAERER